MCGSISSGGARVWPARHSSTELSLGYNFVIGGTLGLPTFTTLQFILITGCLFAIFLGLFPNSTAAAAVVVQHSPRAPIQTSNCIGCTSRGAMHNHEKRDNFGIFISVACLPASHSQVT